MVASSYAHLHNTLHIIILTQYSINKGLELFGHDGVNALSKKLWQVHDCNVFNPKDPELLTLVKCKAALEYLMFLKNNVERSRHVDVQMVGSSMPTLESKEETSSPTVATEALFLSCIIDAEEGRDIATVNVPGAFMHADMDSLVRVQLARTMAKLLIQIDPQKYRSYITWECGKPVLYVQLKKALYGMLQAVLLFCKLLSSKLQERGYVINPYNWCVANKIIDGKQCTIVWHMGSLKISHMSLDVVTDVIRKVEEDLGAWHP